MNKAVFQKPGREKSNSMKRRGKSRSILDSFVFILMTVILLLSTIVCYSEGTAWDCPECGRIENTGNYCGGCAHPTPWIEADDYKSSNAKQEFLTVGSIVTFGHYEQDNEISNGTEEIEWIVLDVKGNKALLLSLYGLDTKPYNSTYKEITWETCTLRAWLNDKFLNGAFSAGEQTAILTTAVDNSINQRYSGRDTIGGKNTQDQIFLLSSVEANQYLDVTYVDKKTYSYSNNKKSRTAPTASAIKRGALTSSIFLTAEGEPAGWWWLRSPYYSNYCAAYVHSDGSLQYKSVHNDYGVVRPALWVNLESDFFESGESN